MIRIFTALCFVLIILAPAAAHAADEAVVLVPFSPPQNTDDALKFATEELIKKLGAVGYTVALTDPMDAVDAASSVADICKKYSAGSVLIGSARHEQNWAAFQEMWKTFAEVHLTRFGCAAGKALWKGVATKNLNYTAANPRAAVSAVLNDALDNIVQQLTSQPK